MHLLSCEFWTEAYHWSMIPVHSKHGTPFAPAGAVKFWVKASTPAFGFFLYCTLDKVVCPYLANFLGMCIFHANDARRDEGASARYSGRVSILLVLSATPATKRNRRSLKGLSRCRARRLDEVPELCVSTRIQVALTWFEHGPDKGGGWGWWGLINQASEHLGAPLSLVPLVANEVCFWMKALNRGKSIQEKAQITRK